MTQGYVYVLKNPAHKDNLFKVGKTTRTVKERIKELSHSTAVPSPYQEAYSILFNDCHSAEMSMHKSLTVYRQGKDREFFEVDLWIIIRELTNLKIAELELCFKENLDKKEEDIAILQKQLVISKQNLDKKDKEIVIFQKELATYKQNISEINKQEVNVSLRDDLKDFIQVLFSNLNNIVRNTLVYLSKNYTKDGLRAKTLTIESIYKNIGAIIAIELLATFNIVTYQKLKDKYNISVFEWENDINEHKKFYFKIIIDICLDMNLIKGFAGGGRRFLLTKDGFNYLKNTKIESNYQIEDIMTLYLESFQRNKDEANSSH